MTIVQSLINVKQFYAPVLETEWNKASHCDSLYLKSVNMHF